MKSRIFPVWEEMDKTLRSGIFWVNAKKKIFLHLFLIVSAGFLVYVNSLSGKFIWDDKTLIRDNTCLESWSNLPMILAGAGSGAGEQKGDFYRPVQLVTYLADRSLWGLNPAGYHLTSIIFHLAAAVCFYWFISVIYADLLLALLAALLFVVHPVHTEAVAYISGRADPIAAVFFLLSLIFYIKSAAAGKKSLYACALVFFVFSLMSRENALVFPAAVLLYHYVFNRKAAAGRVAVIFAIALGYVGLRFFSTPLDPLFSSGVNPGQRLPGFFAALAAYVRLLVFPFNLHMEYGSRLFDYTHPLVWSGIGLLSMFLVYSFFSNRRGIVFFSLSWFLVNLLPFSNLYPLNAYMAEHWLYIPSMGFFLIAARGLRRIGGPGNENKSAVLAVALPVLIFYAAVTVSQNNYWKDSITFHERTIKFAPGSMRMYFHLGNAYVEAGRGEDAVKMFSKAIALDPGNALLYNRLGTVYAWRSKNPQAEAAFKKAIEIKPSYADAYENLGILYQSLGEHGRALPLLVRAAGLAGDNAEFIRRMGTAFYFLGEKEKAVRIIRRALGLDPDCAQAYNDLAIIYYGEKEYGRAARYLKEAVKRGARVHPGFLRLINRENP